MIYKISWDSIALDSYFEESDFILRKWNQKEVEKFQILVKENLLRLSKNPDIGTYNAVFNVFSIVVSKQTTLFYTFEIEKGVLKLHLFWNKLKNPDDLKKFL